MIFQKEMIAGEELRFQEDSLEFDMDKDGRQIAIFYLPVLFNPEAKIDIKCGEEPPNIYLEVTEDERKKKGKRHKVAMYLSIWNAPQRPEYDWDRVRMVPGQISVFISAIDKFLSESEMKCSFQELFQNCNF